MTGIPLPPPSDDLSGLTLEQLEAEALADGRWPPSQNWMLNLGPIRRRVRANSGTIFNVVLFGHTGLALLGLALILLTQEPWRDVGTALLTGALFGLGAYGVAWWESAMEMERWWSRLAYGPDDERKLAARLRRSYMVRSEIDRRRSGRP